MTDQTKPANDDGEDAEGMSALAGILDGLAEQMAKKEAEPSPFPLTVNKISMGEFEPLSPEGFGSPKVGTFVSIRPCGEEHKGRTYLGVYIGNIAMSVAPSFDKETGVLTLQTGGLFSRNPAIFVPDLAKVVYGYESWWGEIKDEKSLREITIGDIENVWYVQALKALNDKKAEKEPENA